MSDSSPMMEGRPTKRPRLSPEVAIGNGQETAMQAAFGLSKAITSTILSDEAKEAEIGVTEFVSSDVTPFQAVLKKRYTDFMVNEILPDQQIVHLTDTSLPKSLQSSTSNRNSRGKQQRQEKNGSNGITDSLGSVSAAEAGKDGSEAADNSTKDVAAAEDSTLPAGDISDEDKRQLITYLNERAVSELLELHKDILANPTRKSKDRNTVRTEFTSDRDLRSEIHGAIRRIFAFKIESSTDNEGILCLTAANPKSRKPQSRQNDGEKPYYPGKIGWIERGGEYLHFTLYKENKDTMEAIGFLTRQLRINAKAFQFAGTKDRRAVTAQRVSAHRLDAERLAKQNHHLRMAAVGNFEYKPAGLELGDLGGNEFVLTLRECQFSDISDPTTDEGLVKIQNALEAALSNLHTKGYLNYFGLQRFGTFLTRTDTIGLHILRNDFRSACDAILQYDSSILTTASNENEASIPTQTSQIGAGRDEIQRSQAIHLFRTQQNAHKALEILPRKFSAENQLIRHLARSPTDYIGALLTIPRNLRLMYVHAYQSLVWNKATTNRWQTYGSRVVEGDLVLVKEHLDKESTSPSDPSAATGAVDADGEIIIAPSQHDRSTQVDDFFERARALTKSEAESGAYTIFDLVMPLPGFDILYPPNSDFYSTFMASDEGGNLDPNNMRRKHREFSLSGGYRKMMTRIGPDFGVTVHRYTSDEEQFVQTDLEKIQARDSVQGESNDSGETKTDDGDDVKMTTTATATETENEKKTGDGKIPADKEQQIKVAAVLKFQLGASQYATMALRELSRGGIVTYKTDYSGGRG